jgi:glycosyltransferase involved in cell wall biosynthesis
MWVRHPPGCVSPYARPSGSPGALRHRGARFKSAIIRIGVPDDESRRIEGVSRYGFEASSFQRNHFWFDNERRVVRVSELSDNGIGTRHAAAGQQGRVLPAKRQNRRINSGAVADTRGLLAESHVPQAGSVEDTATVPAFLQNRAPAGSGKCLTAGLDRSVASLRMSATDQWSGRWICCQLGAREHYAVARSIHQCNRLELLVTDVWVRPGNLLGRLKPGLSGRHHAGLATAEVYARNGANIAFEVRSKFAGLTGWPRIIARNKWFQKVAAERLTPIGSGEEAPVVMAYSYAALDILQLARSRGWRTVLGQIDPGPCEEEIVSKLHDAAAGQGSSWERAPQTYWSEWRRECALADRIVVNSSWSRDALVSEGISSDKIRVVPLAYERPRGSIDFRRRYPARFDRTRPLRVLFLGQVNLRKGIAPILAAVRLLRDEPVEFTFVGPIQISIPSDLLNGPRLRWLGPVSRRATEEFYRNADVLLFPTFSDGFGLTQLEAQAWNLPVIATAFCGEVVRHGRNGWVLPAITPSSIATVLRELLRDPSRLQAASDHSELDEKFDLSNIGRQWLNVLE